MKRIVVCLLLLPACLALAPAAWATWGSFVTTGAGTAIGTPSCAQVSTGQVACAVRSAKSTIMVNQFNGTAWGKWTSLAGAVSSDVSCTRDGAGKVICAATATNGNLQVTILSGGIWSTPVKIKGLSTRRPAVRKGRPEKYCALPETQRAAWRGQSTMALPGAPWRTLRPLSSLRPAARRTMPVV